MLVAVLREETNSVVLCMQITALGTLDLYARRFNMVHRYLVPSRLASSGVEYELYGVSFRGLANRFHRTAA